MILVQILVKDLFNMIKKNIFLQFPIDYNVLRMYDPE